MAEVIKEVSPRGIYNWSLWTNGDAYRAKQGVDFQVPVTSFKSTLHKVAQRKDLDVTVRVDGQFVEFKFTAPIRRYRRSR